MKVKENIINLKKEEEKLLARKTAIILLPLLHLQ